jgi:hypothetical protein
MQLVFVSLLRQKQKGGFYRKKRAFITYNYTRAFFCRSKLDISMRILLPGNLTKKTASEKIMSP